MASWIGWIIIQLASWIGWIIIRWHLGLVGLLFDGILD